MDNQTSFEPAALPAAQLDEAVAGAGARLEQYLAAPDGDAAALLAARGALRRLHGALKASHLEGVAVFCAGMETVLGELSSYPGMASALHRDVLQRAWSGMAGYLDDLAHGADNAALRLFPLYQELEQLRGLEMAFEQDLFYPELAVRLPAEIMDITPSGDVTACLKAARGQYQRGLLQWLRQDDPPGALQAMQQAVAEALRCLPQDESRAFWWVAYGLLDCMGQRGLPDGLDARRLLGRIDQHLRSIAEGHDGDVRTVMNEMLYLIGRCHAASDTAEEICRVYRLERYLPELAARPVGEADAGAEFAALPDEAVGVESAEAPVTALAEPLGSGPAHPTMLFEVASDEALQYARALRQHLAAFKASNAVPSQFIYTAHALAEANRFLKVQPVIDLATALEDWLRAHKDTAPEPDAAQFELLDQTVTALEGMAQIVSDRRMPQAQPALVRRLRNGGPAAVPRGDEVFQGGIQVCDDVDAQLLPVFLEEADGLGRKIVAVLATWRGSPDDGSHPQTLKRLLHTLKGSARMTGAMRIGEIVHAMEDLAGADARARMDASFWDAFNDDLDRIAGLIEELRTMGSAVQGQRAEDGGVRKDDSRAAMSARAHAGGKVQEAPMSTRMVPFASIGERLYRTVRQTAKELNKRANLELPGAGAEVDSGMLERMTAPLEHLLRNAIVHGLESEPVRIRCGKSPIGEIRLGLRRENHEVVFEFSDDGAGLNFAALREKALELGLLRPDEAAGDERLAQLVFVSGFSTATEVSEVAGRGVGLDVVRTEVEALGGHIEVDSKSGQGTRFTIRLPACAGRCAD